MYSNWPKDDKQNWPYSHWHFMLDIIFLCNVMSYKKNYIESGKKNLPLLIIGHCNYPIRAYIVESQHR